MSNNTAIEWTDRTWNPLAGYLRHDVFVLTKDGGKRLVLAGTRGWFCTKCSPGCAHCYAEKINLRLGNGLEYAVRNLEEIEFRLVNLEAPLRWRKPQRVFVNSMTDLFHESVPEALIDQVFAVMALAPHITFQVLTKRAKRMREYVNGLRERSRNRFFMPALFDNAACLLNENGETELANRFWKAANQHAGKNTWPLPNVWLGVSTENQACADDRIPELLATPAAVRFLSVEPMLGVIDPCLVGMLQDAMDGSPMLHWVICGGESGVKARPMHPDWARSLRDQCVAAGVPFLFKQWGEWGLTTRESEGPTCRGMNELGVIKSGASYDPPLSDGGISWALIESVGKKAAGRLLDGREWNEFPGRREVREGGTPSPAGGTPTLPGTIRGTTQEAIHGSH